MHLNQKAAPAGLCCFKNVVVSQLPCTAKDKIFTMSQCLAKVCNKHEGIIFGQCKAPILAMWGGSFGVFTMVAGFGAVYAQVNGMVAKGCNIACAVLAIITCGISLAAFFYSFYNFGSGNLHDRANFAIDGNILGSDCNYNFTDSHPDFKTVTAFACITALWAIFTSIVVCLTSQGNEAHLSEKQNLTQGLATSMDGINTNADSQQSMM